MLFLYMAYFMGNDGIQFFRLKRLDQCIGHQDVSKFFYQAHDAGGNHPPPEYRPVKNICILYPRFLAQLFNPLAQPSIFQRFAPPEFLNHRRNDDDQQCQEQNKRNNLPLRRGQDSFGS